MRVVTPAEMREADRRTIERGTPGLELMERAGAGAARVVRDHFVDVGKRRFLVLCGKGNNGGDGFVVARILAEWGARVDILCMAPLDSLTGDAGTNAARALDAGLSAGVYPDRFRDRLNAADGVIDALLGTGVEGAPRDPFPEVIRAVNGSGCPSWRWIWRAA